MAKPSTITIDGPAASGKSTVAEMLARSLGYFYFDTGIMYRTVTWAVLNHSIEVQDLERVSDLAETIRIDVKPEGPQDGRQATVLADGQDVTWLIRAPEVDAAVSRVSSYPRVRQALTEQQRRIAREGQIVMAGRDIGTVVLPEADLKIFLTASPEERAQRRYRELVARGQTADYDQILAAIIKRDQQDHANPVSPMVPAADAILINTDGLTLPEVLEKLEQLVAQYRVKAA